MKMLAAIVSVLLVFALADCGMALGELSSPTLQMIRGDEYADWTLVYCAWLFADHRAAIFVCENDNQTAIMITEKAGKEFIVVSRNNVLFANSILKDRNELWIQDKWKDGQPYVWYTGENPIDTFYLTMEKNEAGVWQITSGFFGDEDVDDYITFFVTNDGTALAVNDVISGQPKVYMPLEWDATLQGFNPQVARAACKEAMTHLGEPGIIPSTLEPNALPQGSVITLRDDRAYPVYTGPGEEYLRLGGGWDTDAHWEASVSNESWIQAFGQENGWVFIRYDSMRGNWRVNRFGYVPRSAFATDADIPALTWTPYDAVIAGGLESDPLTSAGECYFSLVKQPCRVLATMGHTWLYVEAFDENGAGYRGFVLHSIL